MARARKWQGSMVLAISIAVGLHALPSAAADKQPPDPTQDEVLMTAGFLSGHPDLRYRLLGLEEFKKKNYQDAFRFFQRAAYYGDKPSQGMVAELLWNGQGVEHDPAAAYAWIDLAAERGYEGFVRLREQYWSRLDEPARARALQEGEAIYAKYGDEAATPRLAAVLRRERRKSTGSRTGFTGNAQIYVPGPGGYQRIDASKFYDERYWDPAQYQAWQDSIWMKPRTGKVEVGEVEQVGSPPPSTSRVPRVEPQVDAEEPQTPAKDESDLGTRPPH